MGIVCPERYPTLVYLYPGEKKGAQLRTQFGMLGTQTTGTYMNLALYASRGYAVFVPDSSFGVGHPMQDIADEILPGVDKVVEMGIAEYERSELTTDSGSNNGQNACQA